MIFGIHITQSTARTLNKIFSNVIFVTCTVTAAFILYVTFESPKEEPERTAFISCAVILITYYLWLSHKNPGYIPQPIIELTKEEAEDLPEYSQDPHGEYCSYCRHLKPVRAKHCRTCNYCVRKYDHHCPCLGQCVGERNHIYFLIFLCMLCSISSWSLLLLHKNIYRFKKSFKEINNYLLIIAYIISIIAIIMSSCLSFCHMFLLFFNVTSWEFIKSDKISYLKNLSEFSNPFSEGIFINCFRYFIPPKDRNHWKMVYRKNRKIVDVENPV